jgi:hypothetical protein
MANFYYCPNNNTVYENAIIQGLFGKNPETTDVEVLNTMNLYPVIETNNPYDPNLYIPTAVYTVVGSNAVQSWTEVSRPLEAAKTAASGEVKNTSNTEASNLITASGVNVDIWTGAASQNPADRPAIYTALLDQMTTIGDTLAANLAAIDAATSVDEIDSIVHQPSGTLVVGRDGAGPDDMTPAYFTDLTNLPPGVGEPELEIYIPGTDTVIPYDAGLPDPYRFDSAGNCYNTGDYRTTIRVAATGQVLSTVTPAAGPAVPIAWTYNPTIPPAPGGGSEAF